MLQKLKLKLVVINVALLAAVLIAVFMSVYFLLESQLKTQEKTLLERVASSELAKAADITEKDAGGDEFSQTSSSSRMFFVKTYENGEIINISSNAVIKEREYISYLLKIIDNTGDDSGEADLTEHIKLSFFKAEENGIKIYVFMERETREKTMSAYIYTAFFAFTGAIMCVFLVSVFVADRAIEPVRVSMERQKKFVADASHELRTPIAVIRSNTELLMDSASQTIGENMKWLEYIHKEAVRMTKMTEDLLLLSRADAKNEVIKENIDLSALVFEVYDSFTPLLAENGLTADGGDITPEIYIRANGPGIKQLITILMDNAIKYTKPGGNVSVKLEAGKGSAYIKVIDTGAGMQKELLDKIFERFFRADKTRSKLTGGFGLGLSIAKTIAEEHGGSITVESEPDKGSVFCVELPLTGS